MAPSRTEYHKKWYQENKERIAKNHKAWAQKNPEKNRSKIMRYRYGIEVEEYDQMFEQQKGLCAICQTPGDGRRLSVDHCHSTKIVRGLLCQNCNAALGMLRDDAKILKRAIEYLGGSDGSD